MLRKTRLIAAVLLAALCILPTACADVPDTAQSFSSDEGASIDRPPPEEPDTPPEPTLFSVTPAYAEAIRVKREQNPDSVGWLYIPDTHIDDVIVQNPIDATNDYYLNVNFGGEPDRNGVYCADRRARFGAGGRADLSRVTALYGHSWDDDPEGTLFSQLKKYRDEDFAREHPYLFFSTEWEDMAWEVFAVFDTTIYLPYILPELDKSTFQQMLSVVRASSIYTYDVAVDSEDKLLVLSTCTMSVPGYPSLPAPNDYRFVIMARLADPQEPVKETADLAANPYPIQPDATLVYRSMWES